LLIGAQHASENGALVRAIRLFGAAEKAMPQYQFEQDSPDLADYERGLAAARVALDPDAFTLAWAEGQAMTLEQAILCALEE
jgi:hypothetical protein